MARQFRVLAIALPLAAAQTHAQPSLYQQASSEIRQGDFGHAIPILENLLVQSPNDIRARNLLGIALAGAGQGDEANQQFKRVLEADAKFLPALKNLAANELQMSLREDARTHFETALTLAPDDPAVHFGLAEIAFAARRFDLAFEHYGKSTGLYLHDASARLNYAATAAEMNHEASAVEALKGVPPESGPEIHFEAGLALSKLQHYVDAAGQFELARKGAPDPYQVDFNLTLAFLKSGNFAAALKNAQQMIAGGERTAEAYSLLAQAHERLGQTSGAYEALRSATQIYPNDEAAYLELIALCAEHENYDLGLEIADIGMRLIPLSRKLPIQRGIVLAMMGKYEEAERNLTAPEDTPGWIARSLVLMHTDRVEDAVADLRRLKSRNGDDYLVNWFLAEALTQAGGDSEKEAIAALEKSVQLNPDVPQSRLLLGKLLFAKGETGRALEQLERALALDPGSIPVAYQLARALRKNGDKRRAEELFARVGKQKADGGDEVTRGGLLRIVRQTPH